MSGLRYGGSARPRPTEELVVHGIRQRLKRLVALAIGVACLGGAAPPPVISPIADITQTATGRALARAVAARLGTTASELVVLRDAWGITVGPRAASYAVVAGAAVPLSRASSTQASTVAAAPSWSYVAGQCFSRLSDGFAWIDHCYVLYRLAGDGDGTRDWFALNHYATMQPNAPWVMNAAEIGSQPVGATPQTWVDWAPRGDLAGPCHQILVGISAPVGGIADTATQCEIWTIAKSPAGGRFAVRWDGRGMRRSRELAMEISVSVPQGAWPVWALPASVSGSPF